MARLDASFRPVATKPVDDSDGDAILSLGATIRAELASLGVDDQAEAVLRAVIEVYSAGDETVRAAVRTLFDRYPSFRWAANLRQGGDTVAEFRAQLICLSARDQGADTRDEILARHHPRLREASMWRMSR